MKAVAKAAVLAAAVGLVLAGCSNPAANGGSGTASGVKADGTDKVKAKTLTVWANPADSPAVKDVYTRFSKESGVKLNIVSIPAAAYENQIQTKWSSGDRPDILEYHATSLFWALNPAQNLIDLSKMPYVAKSGDVYKSVGSLNGKVYAAMTVAPGLLGMFYNKDVFAKNGLTEPKSFADLQSICTTLKAKDPGVAPIYEAGGDAWPTQILPIDYMSSAEKQGFSTDVLDKKATLDSADSPFVKALEAYQKLQKDGCFNKDATTGTYAKAIPAVATGKAAMTAQGSDLSIWNQQFGGDTAKTDATIGFAPVAADGPTAAWGPSLSGTWYVPKTGNVDRESTALAFIQWATGKGYQGFIDESKTAPLISTATAPTGIQTLQQQIDQTFKDDSALAFNSNLVGFNTSFPNYTTGVLSGQGTPQSEAKQAQTAFEQGAKAAHLPGW